MKNRVRFDRLFNAGLLNVIVEVSRCSIALEGPVFDTYSRKEKVNGSIRVYGVRLCV